MSTENVIVKKSEKNDMAKAELTRDRPIFLPDTDIYENEEGITLLCDMPGVNENNIDVSLENEVLTITGYQEEEEFKNYELLHQEVRKGIYQRSFTISEAVNRSKIKASLKQGVLKIELPKAEEAKPKKIKVDIEK